jgi:hypothetical protein
MNYRISDEMLVLSASLVCMKFCRQSKEQVHMYAILHRTTSIKRAADNKPTISGRINAASRKHQAQEKLLKVITVPTHLVKLMTVPTHLVKVMTVPTHLVKIMTVSTHLVIVMTVPTHLVKIMTVSTHLVKVMTVPTHLVKVMTVPTHLVKLMTTYAPR